MDHAILPPSSASSWEKCAGWVTMAQWFPQEEDNSDSALEGIEAHELCAKLLYSQGALVGAGDMYDAAKEYVDNILSVYQAKPHTMIAVEQRVSIPRIHKDCWGTPDASLYDDQKKVLFIWDFKYGMGIVDVFENAQMICYAAGLLEKHHCDDLNTRVIMRIVQPRAFHPEGTIREWSVMASDLRAHINRLANAAQVAMSGGDCLSGSQCRYCNAKHSCPAAIQAGVSLYEVACAPTPEIMSNEALGVQYAIMLRAKKQLEYIVSGFEAEIKSKLKSGQVIPGWEVTQGYGNRKWSVSNEELFEYGDMLGIDLRAPTAPITPTKAEALGKEVYQALSGFVTKPLGGVNVTPVNNKKIREVFTK